MKRGNINKIFLLTFVLLTSFVLINIASATNDPCSPKITLVNQDPNPAIPDDYVKVLFEVTELSNCNGFSVNLNPQYPFSLDPETSSVQTISSIPFVQDSKSSWMVSYKLRLDKDAFDGDYVLKLQYHNGVNKDFSNSYNEAGFNLTVKDSRIAFDSVIQEVSGNSVSIAIANIGKYAANSVVVRIPEQDSFTASGTDGQMVGNLASGDYTLVGFTVSPKTLNFAGNFSRGQMSSRNFSAIRNDSLTNPQLKFDIYYTDNIGIRRVVNMALPLRMGNSSTVGGVSAYSRRTTAISTSWYSSLTNWIIIIVVVVILYILYRRYEETGSIKGIFHKNNSRQKSGDDVPDWVKNSKEKEKKK